MNKNLILQSKLEDIIFDGKNKSYGAYELRLNYNKRITKALLSTFFCVGFIILFFGVNKAEETKQPVIVTTEVTLTDVNEPKTTPPPPPPPPKEIQTTQPSVVKYTTPIIVENPTEPPPAQLDIKGAEIGTVNRTGDTCQVQPIPIDIIGGKGDEPVEPEIFERVEIEASFPGGELKWRQYLERTLSGSNPADNGAPEGVYKTLVQFVVDVDGTISNVTPLTNYGYGMEEMAVRTIKKGPKWTPAVQNGRQVKAYRKQMITFQVVSE